MNIALNLWTLDVFCVSVNPSTDNDWILHEKFNKIAGDYFCSQKGLKFVNLKHEKHEEMTRLQGKSNLKQQKL